MKIPLKEMLGTIPGFVGIRLEEEPKFDIIHEDHSLQIRQYQATVQAQTVVDGDRDTAVDEGFRRLAGYIFGQNEGSTQMSMTTPVLQGTTLPMTTPVLQENKGASWTISFILPADVSVADAPVPTDKRVKIVNVAPKLIACLRYTGNNVEAKMHEEEAKLLAQLKASAYQPLGAVTWAQYDQPFAIPFLKRNEAQVEVASKN